MDALNLWKENTVCPKVLTTGTPRTYSTASLLMRSSAFWYCRMSSCMAGPAMRIMTAKLNAIGTRQAMP